MYKIKRSNCWVLESSSFIYFRSTTEHTDRYRQIFGQWRSYFLNNFYSLLAHKYRFMVEKRDRASKDIISPSHQHIQHHTSTPCYIVTYNKTYVFYSPPNVISFGSVTFIAGTIFRIYIRPLLVYGRKENSGKVCGHNYCVIAHTSHQTSIYIALHIYECIFKLVLIRLSPSGVSILTKSDSLRRK